jgi:hypothetical protein
MEGPLDPGCALKGQLSKTLLRNRALRQNYNRLQRLDETDSNSNDDNSCDDGGTGSDDNGNGNENDDNTDEEEETSTLAALQAAAALPTVISTIQDRLPPQYKEQWKRSGISLDNHNNTANINDATALGINLLAVPTPQISTDDEFKVFLEDAKLLEEIRKDVVRTHPDLFFFLEPQGNLGLRRYAAIERVLFVWSKLNKGVSRQSVVECTCTMYSSMYCTYLLFLSHLLCHTYSITHNPIHYNPI